MAYSVLEQIEKHDGTITVTAAAKILGVSRKTIYGMIHRGKIPTLQCGLPTDIRIDPQSWLLKLTKDNPILRMARREARTES